MPQHIPTWKWLKCFSYGGDVPVCLNNAEGRKKMKQLAKPKPKPKPKPGC